MDSKSGTKTGKEETKKSRQSIVAARNERPVSPTTDGIEVDPEEPSHWEDDPHGEEEAESMPHTTAKLEPTTEDESKYCPEMEVEDSTKRETELSLMEKEPQTGALDGTEIDWRRRTRARTTSSSSSSEWSRNSSIGTELTQRAENLVEINRTLTRLRSLQHQMAIVTEQYTARIASLQEQQEECSAKLWRQQQLQGELQVMCKEAAPQEMSSNGQLEKAPVTTRSDKASNATM